MLTKNEILKVTIIDMTFEGQGVAKVLDVVIFVKDAVIGDVLNAKIIKVKKNYAFAIIDSIITQSEHRVKPNCQYFAKCGGCDYLHISYDNQLVIKKDQVKKTIERATMLNDILVRDVVKMDNPFNYRNKASFPIKKIDNKIVVGFYKKRSHDIVPIESCIIQDEVINQVLHIMTDFFNENNISVYNENTNTGILRHLVVRHFKTTNETMVCLVINDKKFIYKDNMLKALSNIKSIKSISINYNKKPTNVILGTKTEVIYGTNSIKGVIASLTYDVSIESFYQVNSVQTNNLYDIAVNYLNLTGSELVVDAYCGIGTISLLLAQKAEKVIGIEVVEQAILNANENAKSNNITNVTFIAARAEEEIKKIKNIDALVVDPPRKGLDEIFINEILTIKPKDIVYISCDVNSLARDLKLLIDNYAIIEVTPVDMFCHSTGVETIVLLSRVK